MMGNVVKVKRHWEWKILRVWIGVKRGDWVVVTYDSKLYPGKVSNKDVNGMTVPCQKDEIYYTFENVHKKIDPPFPLNSKRQMGF